MDLKVLYFTNVRERSLPVLISGATIKKELVCIKFPKKIKWCGLLT